MYYLINDRIDRGNNKNRVDRKARGMWKDWPMRSVLHTYQGSKLVIFTINEYKTYLKMFSCSRKGAFSKVNAHK